MTVEIEKSVSKKDAIKYYFELNESLPPDRRLSNNEISKKVGCTPMYVSDVKKVWMKERVLSEDSSFMSIAKTEGERTLLVLKETTDSFISLRDKINARIEETLKRNGPGTEIRSLVDAVANLARELRQSMYFVHELRGDLGTSKQGNIIVFYNNLLDEFVKVLMQFVSKLPSDLKIEFLEILNRFSGDGRNYRPPGEKRAHLDKTNIVSVEVIDATEEKEETKEDAVQQ